MEEAVIVSSFTRNERRGETMRRTIAILSGVALTMVFAGAAFAATAAEAPEVVSIDDCMAKKSAVEFPHKVHAGAFECVTCHHTQEGLTADSTEEVQACASCHKDPEAEGTPDCSQMSLSKNPFHMSCISCHKEKAAEDEAFAGPVKCDGCHPKAE
jgi:hypothetical protein